LTFVKESIGEFIVLFLTGVVLVSVSTALVIDFHSFATQYARHLQAWYDRPRWRWLHPTTETQDRVGIRLASGLGLAMGVFIVAVEVAALASGHVG
jgi:hypothetical protein